MLYSQPKTDASLAALVGLVRPVCRRGAHLEPTLLWTLLAASGAALLLQLTGAVSAGKHQLLLCSVPCRVATLQMGEQAWGVLASEGRPP